MRFNPRVLTFFAALGGVGVCAAPSHAAPVAAKGAASVTEFKKNGTLERARATAMARARRAALESAIGTIEGAVDAEARRVVLGHPDAWTGAYRVLSETNDGAQVDVVLLVDIDLPRLAKRVEPRADLGAAATTYALGRVMTPPPCSESLAAALRLELESMGVVQGEAGPMTLQVQLGCAPLGGVPHTHLQAAKLQIAVWQGSRPWRSWSEAGLGHDDAAALADAAQRATETLGRALAQRSGSALELRIVNPFPSARVRRLERAIQERVRGVRHTEVAAVDPSGAVRLRIRGPVDPERLGRELEALSLPGFSLTITDTHADGTISLRFEELSTATPG